MARRSCLLRFTPRFGGPATGGLGPEPSGPRPSTATRALSLQCFHHLSIRPDALASLPPVGVTLPLDILAGHPSPWMRALAAVVWAQRPDEPEEIGVTSRGIGRHTSADRWRGASGMTLATRSRGRSSARIQGVRCV